MLSPTPAGYLAFPTTVGSNVLNTFPSSDMLMQVARAVIGVVVVGHYPLNHHPARHAFEDLLHALFNVNSVSPWLSALITVAFVSGTLSIALVVTDLGAVLHMIGGTAASLMIFAIPGLLLMNAAIIKHTVLQETFEVSGRCSHEFSCSESNRAGCHAYDMHPLAHRHARCLLAGLVPPIC